jgi:glycerol 2-dehydrogenase (NADP+)
VRAAVANALKAGYRHLDCAHIYLNEQEVGQGIIDSGVARKDIFVTSKVWCLDHDDVEKGLSVTLANLGLDYVDLYVGTAMLGSDQADV